VEAVSGGSYHYLYCHVSGLEKQRDDIERMARRLEESGYYAPARVTRNVLVLLDGSELAAQALEDVRLAVEWADSGDSSEEQVAGGGREVQPVAAGGVSRFQSGVNASVIRCVPSAGTGEQQPPAQRIPLTGRHGFAPALRVGRGRCVA
jgi:hypothetical protein